MNEFDRYYVPDEFPADKPVKYTHARTAKFSGKGYYDLENVEQNKLKSPPEIVKVFTQKEAEALLKTNGNVAAFFYPVMEHDVLESVEKDDRTYEIWVKGFAPVGFTNNEHVTTDQLKELYLQ